MPSNHGENLESISSANLLLAGLSSSKLRCRSLSTRGEASFELHSFETSGDFAIVTFVDSGELLSTARLARGLPTCPSDRDAIVGLWDAVSDFDRTWIEGSP